MEYISNQEYFEAETRSAIDSFSQKVQDILKRLEKTEYICRRLLLINPDLEKTNCAMCKYLFYGVSVGKDVEGKKVMLCKHCKKDQWQKFGSTTGDGCYKWEPRKGEE